MGTSSIIQADASNSEVNTRLNVIEGLLSRLVSSLPQAITAQAFAGDPGAPDISSLTASGEELFHPRLSAPSPPRQKQPHKPPPSGLFPSNMTTTHNGRSGFGWGLREGRLISLSVDDNQDLREVLATLRESGISKNHLEWVIAGVPGRRMADGLVELYFRYVPSGKPY